MGQILNVVQNFFAPQGRRQSPAAAATKNITFLRSAVQYKPILSNFSEYNLRSQPKGKSLYCGPVDRDHRARRLQMIEKNEAKTQAIEVWHILLNV